MNTIKPEVMKVTSISNSNLNVSKCNENVNSESSAFLIEKVLPQAASMILLDNIKQAREEFFNSGSFGNFQAHKDFIKNITRE